ncbi:conserved hypothetical protein [Histoplasma capsulatum H143]|uniref:Uncharacterized protein n=1 Tax=Ajellomyces capsulatus (strain H143) TaxID=544712 RepID=C6H7C5_AJECH|nr:conserved hypothetical protein [Histoplasma capsulatum H143]
MDKASIQFKHDLMQSMTCSLSGIEFGISCVASKIITDRPPDTCTSKATAGDDFRTEPRSTTTSANARYGQPKPAISSHLHT